MTVETLENRWKKGTITIEMLAVYVRKGIITKDDYELICGKKYTTSK